MTFSTRKRDAATSIIIPVLSTLGGVTIAYCFQKVAKRVIRNVVQMMDPIKPNEEDTMALLKPLLKVENVQDYIKEKENHVVSGAEQCVIWASKEQKKTKLCVVFVHGWSACRQECSPIPERLAKALGANLFCARLPGHGRRHPRGLLGGGAPYGKSLLLEANPRQMFLTVIHALRIGLSLGDQVVFVGMSTGAALLTWLASLKFVQDSNYISAIVFVSPAYGLCHPLYPVLKYIFASLRVVAPQRVREWLLERVLGKRKKSEPLNEDHRRYTTLEYPSAAVLNLLDVLWESEIEMLDMSSIRNPLLMIGNPKDNVVDFRVAAANAFLKFGDSSRKSLYTLTETEHAHCIASKILSPSAVEEITNIIIDFSLQATATPPVLTNTVKTSSKFIHHSSMSVPTGLGLYGRSYPSLHDLTSPLLVG